MDINRPLSSRLKLTKPLSTEAGKKGAEVARNRSSSAAEISNKLELKEGQLLKGQIIDHRHNEIKLMVEPGNQVISARISDEVSLAIGQYAGFIVSEATSDSLVLRLLPQEAQANDSIILKALTAAEIAINARSKAIVEELLAQRMPVDKHTLQTLIRQSAANREASPLCLVLMYKNNIPVNSKNLQQFQAYLDGTHQLLYKIKDITQNIAKILNAPSYPEAVFSDFSDPASVSPDLTNPGFVLSNLQPVTEASVINSGAADKIINPFIEVSLRQTGPSQTDINPMSDNILSLNDNILRYALTINDELIRIYQTDTEIDLWQSPEVINHNNPGNLLTEEAQELKLQPEYQIYKLTDVMKQDDINTLLKHLSSAPDPGGLKNSIANGSATIAETLSYIQHAIYKLDKAGITDLLSSTEYATLLEKAFFKKWTLTSENVSKQQTVEKFYKQLEEDLKKINRLFDTIDEADDYPAIQKPLSNLQDNLQFMKDLNNAFAFLQLPVEFKDRQLHADLYVLKNKKSYMEKEQGLNVHLHLETANLGSLNIHVQMKNKQIETVFYPENSEVEDILRDNLPTLVANLQAKGYKVNADVAKADNQPGLFRKLIEQNIQDNNISRYTFDIRT